MNKEIFTLEPKTKNKKYCKNELCKIEGSYGYDKNNRFCKSHKKDDMIDVIHLNCIEEGCKTRPTFNYENETKGLYCATHKKNGMINVKDKSCIEKGCKTRPIFNYENETKGIYCSAHKKENMIDVINKSCIEEGCKTIPNYNYENETKGIYCVSHKKNGMIDVKHLSCIEEGCKTRPNYNYDGETKGIYCASHKLNNMVDVINKSCKSDWCNIKVYNPKYEGYCLHCFSHMFPDKPVSRNYKTKEREVVQFIKSQFPNHSWISDKKVEDGCSKRRPDILCDLGYQVLIIEIDENQHIDYDCSCENKRIMEISQDINHRPLIFIRFNPDDYKKNDTNITSCWGIGKSGVCSIKKNKKNEWGERLQTLENQISYWLTPENQTNKTVEIIQLFYDE